MRENLGFRELASIGDALVTLVTALRVVAASRKFLTKDGMTIVVIHGQGKQHCARMSAER